MREIIFGLAGEECKRKEYAEREDQCLNDDPAFVEGCNN
jgi:hypothetical protein